MIMELNFVGEVCANCKYYHQHYVRSSATYGGYVACYSGHCVYPRIKKRMPEQHCQHFTEREGALRGQQATMK